MLLDVLPVTHEFPQPASPGSKALARIGRWRSAVNDNTAPCSLACRYATEIFFNTSTAAENLKLYKAIYPDLATPSFQDILEREAARVVHTMLQLRHDAHMFHQVRTL